MESPPTSTFGIFKFIKFTLLGLFIGLLILQALYNSLHEKSLTPFVSTIGKELAYSTTELSLASKAVINQGGYYVRTPDFWTGVWNFFKININFYMSFYTLFMWIFVFQWLIVKSPFGDSSKPFQNYFFAIMLFFLVQGIFILGTAAANKEIDCFSGCEKSSMGYLFSPEIALKDFFLALDYLLRPAFGVVDKVNNIDLIDKNINISKLNDNITNAK